MSSLTTQPHATVVPADPKSAAEAILAKAQSSRTVIQDFVPLADSLEWRLGQEYLRQRGDKAFLSDAHPVPFVDNKAYRPPGERPGPVRYGGIERQARAAGFQLAVSRDLFVHHLGTH